MMTTKNLELKYLTTKNEMEENIIENHQTKPNKKKHKEKETMEKQQYQKTKIKLKSSYISNHPQ